MGSILDPPSTTSSSPEPPISIAIIGGGLTGLALAIALLPYTTPSLENPTPLIHLTIYESTPSFLEIGVGVAFGPNVVRAMSLINPKIVEGFKKYATGNGEEYSDLGDVWASFRWGVDSKHQEEGANKEGGKGAKRGDLITHLRGKGAEPGLGTRTCIHRARFLDVLASLIPPGSAKFGKRLLSIEEQPDGRQKLSFADGETSIVDAVIGCDGIKSATRPYVFGAGAKDISPKFTGEYAYRALVPIAIARETLGDERSLNGQLYVGYGGYIMTYPVENGEHVNIAAVRRKGDLEWDEKNWIIPSTTEDMMSDFQGWAPEMLALISKFENKDKWGFFDLEHSLPYYKGNICIMGDSAHASTPHLGAGAGMGIEDAYVLGNLLGMAKRREDLEGVFAAFDKVRRGRTQSVIEKSRRSGEANELLGAGIDDDFEKLKVDIEERYRWIWEFDLEKQLEEAKKLLVLK